MGFFQNRINAAMEWARQNSPIVKAVQQKSFKPLGQAVYNATAKQQPLDAVTAVMPIAKVKPYYRHSDQEIKTAFDAFQKQIPKWTPLTKAEKAIAENKRMITAQTNSFNNVSRANKIRRQLNNFAGTPEAKFRELISRIQQ